jgi:cobalamin synthase
MYQGRAQVASKYSTAEHTERRTLRGLVAYLLTVPALVAFMAAPAVAVGAVVGVLGVAVGRRVVRRLRWQHGESGFSPSEVTAGQPA